MSGRAQKLLAITVKLFSFFIDTTMESTSNSGNISKDITISVCVIVAVGLVSVVVVLIICIKR